MQGSITLRDSQVGLRLIARALNEHMCICMQVQPSEAYRSRAKTLDRSSNDAFLEVDDQTMKSLPQEEVRRLSQDCHLGPGNTSMQFVCSLHDPKQLLS